MSVAQGTQVTMTDGSSGIVLDPAHYLGGQFYRVRVKDTDELGRWRIGLYREDAFATATAPAAHSTGDRVRIGPDGPPATVTGIVSGDPTLYEVEWTYHTKESEMPIPQAGTFEAWQLV